MFVDSIDPCCTDEQKKALGLMERCKEATAHSAIEQFSDEELAIFARVKQLIEDFWYT